MRNILLTVSYDGTDFCGWQRQDNPDGGEAGRTVQGELEKALRRLHGQPVSLYGSGRTDSGVHALGQAANFFSPNDGIPAANYVRALNAFLPGDVRVMAAEEVPPDFNARFSATSRVYRYFISMTPAVSAAAARFVWSPGKYEPDVERLNRMASCLRGEMDCASFSAGGDGSISTFRYIDGAEFFVGKDMFGADVLVFQIEANAFLWKMVRTVTGTLVGLDRKGGDVSDIRGIIAACDRRKAGITAPPEGLFLYKIKFDGIRRHV